MTVTTTEVGERRSTPTRLWRVDPGRSKVEFRVATFWGLKVVSGRFDRFQGYYLERPEGGIIELTIDARSLDTGNATRDRHLRSKDFFDVEAYSEVRFSSTRVVDLGGSLEVMGTLEAGGRSVTVLLDATVRREGDALEIESATTIDHRALGMTHSPLGMVRPPTRVQIAGRLDLEETT